MRILFVHNRYKEAGGEDVALKLESELLLEKGHSVETLFFDNTELVHTVGKLASLKNAISNRKSAAMLSAFVERFQPDIIHVHNLFFVASPSILEEADKLNVPVVMTLHNYRLVCCNALFLRKGKPCEICKNVRLPVAGIINKCYRGSASASALVTAVTSIHKFRKTWQTKVARYIVLTDFAKEKMVGSSLNVPSDRFTVLPNFVRDSAAANLGGEMKLLDKSQNAFRQPVREDYFLFAGRLTKEKGIIPLVRAFRGMPDLPLYIAGDGPDRALAETQSAGCKNIRFLGAVDRENLQELMKKCKALLFPSIWYEGLPYVILESFCNGTPVIASKLGAMESVIQNNYNGLHFEAGNVVDLCRAVREFLQSGSSLYTGARNSWENHYAPDKHYRDLMNVYSREIATFGKIRSEISYRNN